MGLRIQTNEPRMRTVASRAERLSFSNLCNRPDLGRVNINALVALSSSAIAYFGVQYYSSNVPNNMDSLIGGVAALGTLGLFSLASSIRQNYRLRAELKQSEREKTREVTGLQGQIASLQTTNETLARLKDNYMEGVLSMSEGDRRTFLGMITSQVLFEETPENLSRLIAPFPDETGSWVLRLMSGQDQTMFERSKKAVLAMPTEDQVRIARCVYLESQGDENILTRVFAPLPVVERGFGSRNTSQTPQIPGELLDAITRMISGEVIVEGAPDQLLSIAARSRFPNVRTAAISAFSSVDQLLPLFKEYAPFGNAAFDRALFLAGQDDGLRARVMDTASKSPIRQRIIDISTTDQISTLASMSRGDQDISVAQAAFDKALELSEHDENLRSELLRTAAGSTHEPIRMKVVELATKTQRDILITMIGDNSERSATVAFNKAIELSGDDETQRNEALEAAAKSSHAPLRLTALGMIPADNTALLRIFTRDADAAIVAGTFKKAPAIFDAGDLEFCAAKLTDSAILLEIAAHPNATPKAFAISMLRTVKKVTIQKEEAHDEHYTTTEEDGENSLGMTYRTEQHSNRVVTTPEISYMAIPEEGLNDALRILFERGSNFTEEVFMGLESALRQRSIGCKNDPTENLRAAYKSGWIIQETIKMKGLEGDELYAAIGNISSRLASFDPAEAAVSLSKVEVSLAGKILANMQIETRAGIIKHLPQAFVAEIIGSTQR